MRFLTADYLFPIVTEPIQGGILVMEDDGTVHEILDPEKIDFEIPGLESYPGFLCPGFINTHCHLELSWAKGAIEADGGLDHFLRTLDSLRRNVDPEWVKTCIEQEGNEMLMNGTVAVADVSNSIITAEFKESSPILFYTFCEVFASNPASAEKAFERINHICNHFLALEKNNRASVTPHAPYSLSPELFRLISSQASMNGSQISMHHLESDDENLFFREGKGSILYRRELYNPGIEPFRKTGKSPIRSVSGYFHRSQPILLVHNTYCLEEDIIDSQTSFDRVGWCFCPNANSYIESRLPDIELFRKMNCFITLGTDSLASNTSLSMLEEMKTILYHFPGIPLHEVITWATGNGAGFLGFKRLGSFEQGNKPGVVLIGNVDIHRVSLLPGSTSRLLMMHGNESVY